MSALDSSTPLNVSQGAKFSKILGIGGYRPRRVVDNAEIVTYIDSTDEWIRTRSGISERRWASEDETVSMMSQAAARKAMERAGVEPGQIDTVIVSTVTHLHQTPAIATTIASELGAKNAAAFDISAACAGFCYALAMADSFVRTGASKHVLIIGVERLSDMTDKHDRSTAFIFADGAGAAVVGPSDTPAIGPVVWGSDGDQADLIAQSESWTTAMDADAHDDGRPHWPMLRMNGNPVFKWASYTMAKTAAEAMDAAGVKPEDLEVFVPHQANNRITDAMFKALKLPSDVVIGRDIIHSGNTSAASIPLAIETLLESGQARSGQTCLIIGFGAGLVYAGQVILLP
ncbi:3-oxoacyl-[acyl-carrier-protein] synthase III [Friedmanniella luteola]|uniref:Beta-ketoacyl-[acyl-carrier-protein] synthase III n=1 Tax=Friedmanniella luteola TaxID=546871 RepID=A0A1H1W3J2_9ACTN|nr:beta-ketoacyl-ACP synthase III [Friedmanniella luteola]SDS91290.1 3-oxoacyl-[acyl-carrier-protein] synthase III [Friedmanniella luteola]